MSDEPIVEWFRQSATQSGETWTSKAGWVAGRDQRWEYGRLEPYTTAAIINRKLGAATTRAGAMKVLEDLYEPELIKRVEKALLADKAWACTKCGNRSGDGTGLLRPPWCWCGGKMEEVDL